MKLTKTEAAKAQRPALSGKVAPSSTTCANVGAPIVGEGLRNLFVGWTLGGVNSKGELWEEALGNDGRTAFINQRGQRFDGRWQIQGNEMCFQYGTATNWSCKTISPCQSGEAQMVIRNRDGVQTSLILTLQPSGKPFQPTQPGSAAAPQSSSGARSFTALPETMSSPATDLERIFSAPNLTSRVDLAACQFTITLSKSITEQVLSSGGWSDWMGATTNGQKEVGQHIQVWTVDLEKYNPPLSQQASAGGRIVFNQLPGKSFTYRSTIRRTDNPSLNEDETREIGGFSFTAIDIPRGNALLQELSDVCSGRKKAPVPTVQTAPAANSTAQTVSANCAGIDNDIARLQCYDDAAAGAGSAPGSFTDADREAVRSLMVFQGNYGPHWANPEHCLLRLGADFKLDMKGDKRVRSTIDMSKLDLAASGPTRSGQFLVYYRFVAKRGSPWTVSGTGNNWQEWIKMNGVEGGGRAREVIWWSIQHEADMPELDGLLRKYAASCAK